MSEAPLFTVDPGQFVSGQGYSLQGMTKTVEDAVAGLGRGPREEYLSCHEHRKAGESASREVLIFRSNAYSMPDGQIGIFPRIAKINHSCRPNAVNVFSASLGRRIIWAGRDIAAGEEVTVTYAPLTEPTDKRRARLLQYGFHCDCEACHADGDESSDDRRAEMGRLSAGLETELSRAAYGGDMLPGAERLVSLVEEEGLTDYLAKAYRLAAYAAARNGDHGSAERWSTKELQMHEVADDMSPEAQAARAFAATFAG